jgi:phosphoribosylamine--glycine ligase
VRVAVIGSGGREHALVWSIARSPEVEELWAVPGNPGTEMIAKNVSLDPLDFPGILELCKEEAIDLVVVGPEDPLAAGITDYLARHNVLVFGPTRNGAMLEASKSVAKNFMARHNIPHPLFHVFESSKDAVDYVRSEHGPWVIKADGLAKGKGVTITGNLDEAVAVIEGLVSGRLHGEAGRRIVIEEFLEGREATAMAISDGNSICCLPMAKDHKRAWNGDKGPMTGGMGVFSPLPFVDEDMEKKICTDILKKTYLGLKEDGIDYRGVIYAGLMLTEKGPKVLEYNVRFGDPEAQCVLPRLSGDVAGILRACAQGELLGFLSENEVKVLDESAVTVVVASAGYPERYATGYVVEGIDKAENVSPGNVVLFQAGTARNQQGQIVTAGGRVLSVTALSDTIEGAREIAYNAAKEIKFNGAYYRKDIGRLK